MYRVTKLGSAYFAKSFDYFDSETQEIIITFAEEGVPTIIIDELENLEELGINIDKVEIV